MQTIIKSDKMVTVKLKLTYRDLNDFRAILAESKRRDERSGYYRFADCAQRVLDKIQEQFPVDIQF